MEEGELPQSTSFADNRESFGFYHHPSLEWPGDDMPSSTPAAGKVSEELACCHEPLACPRTIFRLVVSDSSVLPQRHRVAIADRYSEIQFGRDHAPLGSDIPRLRLKEMQVSKLHATIYRDSHRNEWNVVDMGSKYGSFISFSSSPFSSPVRLSSPKISSMPRSIQHLDHLTIGSSTFIVHIHDEMSCEDCSPKSGEEIPLFSSRSMARPHSSNDIGTLPRRNGQSLDHRTALSNLKRNLLSRHSPKGLDPSPSVGNASYVDRSAKRRDLLGVSRIDAPGVPTIPISTRGQARTRQAPPSPSTPGIVNPVSALNVGHHLLRKQGWEPGSALGIAEYEQEPARRALLEPLQLVTSTGRAGLGMNPTRLSTYTVERRPAG